MYLNHVSTLYGYMLKGVHLTVFNVKLVKQQSTINFLACSSIVKL